VSHDRTLATVSAALADLVEDWADAAVAGTDVATVRPDTLDPAEDQSAITVFLYQVSHNPSSSNRDLPTRRADGTLADRPLVALDLDYLLTFFGDERTQVPERLLGAAVTGLEAEPILSHQRVLDAVASRPHLAGSGLADQVERVRLTPVRLNLEELSKLWSVFFQTTYRLSVPYRASVVLLRPDLATRPALPVRRRNLYVTLLRQPAIDAAEAAGDDPGAPLVAGGTLRLRGRRLLGAPTRVAVDGEDFAVDPDGVRDDEVRVPLSAPPFPAARFRAGVHGVQVVHPRRMGTPETLHQGVASNVVPFVLRPSIAPPAVPAGPAVLAPTTGGDGLVSAEIDLRFAPPVGKEQRIALLLNRLDPPAGAAPEAYAFEAPSRNRPAEPATTTQLAVPVSGVEPGSYLVRVQVDGAESAVGFDAGTGRFDSPAVTLP